MGNINQNPLLNQRIKKTIKDMFWKVRRLRNEEQNNFNLSKIITDSYNAGHAFHRKRLKINPDLKKWVMKKNYLDEEQ